MTSFPSIASITNSIWSDTIIRTNLSSPSSSLNCRWTCMHITYYGRSQPRTGVSRGLQNSMSFLIFNMACLHIRTLADFSSNGGRTLIIALGKISASSILCAWNPAHEIISSRSSSSGDLHLSICFILWIQALSFSISSGCLVYTGLQFPLASSLWYPNLGLIQQVLLQNMNLEVKASSSYPHQ